MCARPHQGKFNKHTAPGDTLTDFFSDTGSTPVSSTILCKSELNLLCEALFRICFCFRGCGSVHILFFRRIVSKRLFSIPDASRGRVAPANPRAAYMRPLRRSKKQKAAYLKRDKRLLAGVVPCRRWSKNLAVRKWTLFQHFLGCWLVQRGRGSG